MKNRVVLILSSFPQLSETFIVNKAIGLIQHGWDVHIVCSTSEPKEWRNFPQLQRISDIKNRVHQNWTVYPWWLVLLLFPFAVLKCLITNRQGLFGYFARGVKRYSWKILKRFYLDSQVIALSPDLIHFEFGATAVGRSDLNYLLDCKEVVSFRGYDLNFSGLDKKDYYKEVWKDADAFHFLGKDLYQRALRRGLSSEKMYTLIPPAIDTRLYDPGEKEEDREIGTAERPIHVLSVGRLEWKKGYEFALQAIREAFDRGMNIEYQIIGSGNEFPALAFARHQLGLDAQVKFLGALSSDKIIEALRWADVFLHSAVSEGFCNAVLEAQSMKLPVVCSDAGGLAENVVDGVTGFVVPRRDPMALAHRMQMLAKDPSLREKMGKAGRERVIEMFQIESQIHQFHNFYMSLWE